MCKSKFFSKTLFSLLFIFFLLSNAFASATPELIIDSSKKKDVVRFLFYTGKPVDMKVELKDNLLKVEFPTKYRFILNHVPETLRKDIQSVFFRNKSNIVNIKLKNKYKVKEFIGKQLVGVELQRIYDKPKPGKIIALKSTPQPILRFKPKLEPIFELTAAAPGDIEPETPVDTPSQEEPAVQEELPPESENVQVEADKVEVDDSLEDIAEEALSGIVDDIVEEEAEEEEIEEDYYGLSDEEDADSGEQYKEILGGYEYVPPNNEVKKRNETPLKDIPAKKKIVFKWDEEVGSAIFERGDYLWLVFDRSKGFDVKKIQEANKEYFSEGEQLKNKHYAIMRFKKTQDIFTFVYRNNYDWVLAISSQRIIPNDPPLVDFTDSELHGSAMVVARDENVRPIKLIDPEVGDQMLVVPYRVEGRGIETFRKSTDFFMLQTSQGVALQINSDNVKYKISKKNIEFAGPTNKLSGGAQSALRELQERERLARLREEELKNKSKELTMFKFKTWARGADRKTYTKILNEYFDEILSVNWSKKGEQRLNLARFYFSQGLNAEALSVIGSIEEYNPEYSQTNEVQVLKGAAAYLMGRYKDSAEIFEKLKYDQFAPEEREEAEFWRAAATLRQSSQVQMDKFISNNPTKNKKDTEITSGDKVEVTRLMLETSSRLLKMIRQVDPDFANQDEVQTLESTARFVASHYRETIKRFEETELYKSGDVFEAEENKLWWGTSGFKSAIKYNINFLPNISKFLKYYPETLYNDFALVALDEKIELNDITSAEEILDSFKDEEREFVVNSIEYYKGMFYAKDEEDELAVETWEKLTEKVFDRYNRARSTFAMTVFQLQKRQIDLKIAIERLESIRQVWRGGVLELNILKLLGDFYMDRKEYISGFKVWREVVSTFPGSEEALLVAKGMSEKFIQLFNEGYADEIPKIDALTLFYEFRELTPIGKLGDDMIQRLADRLIELDLLSKAAALLTHQVRFRLLGEEKDKASTKLVEIHLMNNKPQLAFDVLKATDRDGMIDEIALRRKYLKAISLTELGKNNQVLAVLKGDESHKASFLRAEVYWREKVWKKVVDELETPFRELRREEKDLTEEQSNQVIRLAVAYAILERKKRLQILYEDFIPFVQNDIQNKTLTFVASDRGRVDFRDIKSTVGFDDIESFLTKYLESSKVENVDPLGEEEEVEEEEEG